jgi:SM-20-related protein
MEHDESAGSAGEERSAPPAQAAAPRTLDEPRAPWPGLAPDDVARLGAGDAPIFDGVLGELTAHAVAAALTQDEERLRPAAIGRGSERRVDAGVRGDLRRWLEPSVAPPLWELFDRLRRELRERAWLGVDDLEVQLALYPGGSAGYLPHRDAFAAGGRRRVTATYYLNAAWRPGDGGELRLTTPAGPRLVAPLLDRLVLFRSELVPHEVLPARAPRWAVTAWYLGPPASA